MPGAIDDQVHFREPGLTHKEILNQNQELLLRVESTSLSSPTRYLMLLQEILEQNIN
jgi:hypothetical protein